MLVGHLFPFPGEMSIQILCPFLKICLFSFGCVGSSLLQAGYFLVVVHRLLIVGASLVMSMVSRLSGPQ